MEQIAGLSATDRAELEVTALLREIEARFPWAAPYQVRRILEYVLEKQRAQLAELTERLGL